MTPFLALSLKDLLMVIVTAAIPVPRFWGKVLAQSANSVVVSKALSMIESNVISR